MNKFELLNPTQSPYEMYKQQFLFAGKENPARLEIDPRYDQWIEFAGKYALYQIMTALEPRNKIQWLSYGYPGTVNSTIGEEYSKINKTPQVAADIMIVHAAFARNPKVAQRENQFSEWNQKLLYTANLNLDLLLADISYINHLTSNQIEDPKIRPIVSGLSVAAIAGHDMILTRDEEGTNLSWNNPNSLLNDALPQVTGLRVNYTVDQNGTRTLRIPRNVWDKSLSYENYLASQADQSIYIVSEGSFGNNLPVVLNCGLERRPDITEFPDMFNNLSKVHIPQIIG